MVRDDSKIIHDLRSLDVLPEIIEIKTRLPELLNTSELLACTHRWREIRDTFKHPVRVYAICNSLQIEKLMTRLCLDLDDIYLTVIPESREEVILRA